MSMRQHFFNFFFRCFEYLLLHFHLLLLPPLRVFLVHLVLVLPHLFGFSDAELLAFLVPAPLIDLSFFEPRDHRDVFEAFFGPAGLFVELDGEVAELVGRFPLSLANDSFF